MTVFVADKLPQQATDELKQLGLEVNFDPKAKAGDLNQGLGDTDILIVRSTVVSETCIKNSPRLMMIIRAGAGVNNINIEAASNSGIYVANRGGKNSIAVTELTLGLILSLDRFIADNVSGFRNGSWNKAIYSKADRLYGKTIGIIGMGQIVQEVISAMLIQN
ncbi:MAG: hypothetical protein FH748_13395 [Balneolaceae bacterium]|nr:hypothetical protein [Balneolaceae bacterium]